jgi:ATP adenylyltransferase
MVRHPARANRQFEPHGRDQHLWAPWRSAYITRTRSTGDRCIFCLPRLSAARLSRRLVLYAGPQALVMLNRYPYNNGHLIVAPRRHVGSLELLSREERTTVSELISFAVERLRVALSPTAFNLGANLGRAAGAGFADHLHWHVVPRWEGDTNFMPVVASTRVLSQHLEESYALLAPHFKAIETTLF